MEKQKKYTEPQLDIIWFTNDDIITASPGDQVGEDQDIGGIV